MSPFSPLAGDATPGQVCARNASRGELESPQHVEAALAAARNRTSRLPLATQEQARLLVPADWSGTGPLPEWVRLLANFPKAGKAWIHQTYSSETKGRLSAKLKAQIAYVAARNDRAWYALGHARLRLKDLGYSESAIAALDQPGDSTPAAERLVLALASKLTNDPALITDADIEGLRKHYSDHEVAEIIYHVTQAAFFNRLTETAGLRLER
jgi:alkylhydroperoxidase family enzyme